MAFQEPVALPYGDTGPFSPVPVKPPKESSHGNNLHCVVAARTFNQHLDSSESIPSKHGSLCNTVLVSYESEDGGCKRLCQQDAVDIERPHGKASTVQKIPHNALNKAICHRGPVGGAKAVRKGPIAFLSSSAIRPSNSPSSQYPRALEGHDISLRIYSFDDLDIPTSRHKFRSLFSPTLNLGSSCSSESFENLDWLNDASSPAAPSAPIYPPLVRTPTPPGLPSFGSAEAMSYRPSPQARNSRHRPTQHGEQSSRSNGRPTATDYCGNNAFNDYLVRIRRSLSFFSRSPPSRPTLPPGAIARAEDGTFIRGRFGNRQSGHGVGAASLSSSLAYHPFHSRTLETARPRDTRNMAAVGGDGRSSNRSSRPVYKRPPYSSMLDVPVPEKPQPARRVRFHENRPEGIATGTPTGTRPVAADLCDRNQQPRLPRPGDTAGYSSPLRMQVNVDGEENDTSQPSGTSSIPLSHGAKGTKTLDCSCVNVVEVATALWKQFKTCMPSTCCDIESSPVDSQEQPPNSCGAREASTNTQSTHETPTSGSRPDGSPPRSRLKIPIWAIPWFPAWAWQSFSGG